MNNMYERGYKRVRGGTRCNGIRLNLRKISIQRLRVRFKVLLKMLYKWRKSYEAVIKSLRKGISGKRSFIRKNSKSRLIITGGGGGGSSLSGDNINNIKGECRLKSLGRTNSFYTEAIADCLEFIKRNSVSLDHPHPQTPHNNNNNNSIALDLR